MRLTSVLVAATAMLVGCTDTGIESLSSEVAPTPRKMVMWLDKAGVDARTAERLAAAGIDQLVVRRGAILLADAAPVVQLEPRPVVEGPIPTAVELEVRGLAGEVEAATADAVWAALKADFGSRLPAELILDLPELGEDASGFVARLAQSSGLAVVPILTLKQLETDAGRAVAVAAHRCIVPVFGSQTADLRGLGDLEAQPLGVRLATLRDSGVRVRLAAALRPRTEPEASSWAQDIDPLTDADTAEIQRASALDRSFLTSRPLSWAGRSFGPGVTVAVSWVDVARLGAFFAESHRIVLPEIEGWDLVSLPPEGPNLGLDRDELIRYLVGEGPQPTVEVIAERTGRTMVVRVENTGPFRSAITSFGNWVQVELAAGALVASSRGGFDRVILGSVKSGDWRPNPSGGPDAVRFVELYLAPGEELRTGEIRLPSSRSEVVVRWQIQLSDGSVISGKVD